MEEYNRIVVALDLSAASQQVAQRARAIAEHCRASLSIVHVFEYLPPIDVADMPLGSAGVFVDESELKAIHQQRLDAFVEKLGIEGATHTLLEGVAKTEIVRHAEHIRADLIVLGSHGRHGIGLLLGSTANAVLHHAPCDVLAVRIAAD